MIKFRQLFSFRKSEIDKSFKAASIHAKIHGLKLLKFPTENSSKLLIIIPMAYGSAVKRNKLRRNIQSIFYEEKLYLSKYSWIIIAYKDLFDFEQVKKFLLSKILV